MYTNFNPRSHERSDSDGVSRHSSFLSFQSTLPREERPILVITLIALINFNPRSHERSDDDFTKTSIQDFDFNPRSHERSDKIQTL